MIWLLTRPIVWPAKTVALSARAGYLTGRAVGYRRLLVLGVGVGIGMLLAPRPGRELREQLWARFGGGGAIAELGPVTPPTSAPVDTDTDVVDLTGPTPAP